MTTIDKMKNGEFTQGEQLIIDYILNHFHEFEDLTISQLAKQSYTSNATIIRLCHKLKFQGFKQFKIALLKEIEGNKYHIKDVDYTIPFQNEETIESIEQNMYSLHLDTIHHLHASIDLKTVNDISQMLIDSQRIFIFAIGDTKITSMNFINKMIKIGCFPILATEHDEQTHIMTQITKKDCALFITYSGKRDDYKSCIKRLYEKDIPTALITANQNNFMNQFIKHVLYIPDYEKENKIATFYSQISFNYLLNLIYAIIYNTKPL